MYFTNAIFVIISSVILIIGLLYALDTINILQKFNLARPWIILSILISIFLLGYFLIFLEFLNFVMLPWLSFENLVTAIFLLGSIFVLVMATLNRELMINIFGVGMSNAKAIEKFSEHINMPVLKVKSLLKSKYSVKCDACEGHVDYSIPDIVRSHPNIARGVVVDKGMGGTNYRFFVRHYCGKESREIPVGHDKNFEFRTQRPSRLV